MRDVTARQAPRLCPLWATSTRAECSTSDGGPHSRAGAFKTPHRRAYVLTAFESAHQRIEAAFPAGMDSARAELEILFPDTLRDIDRAEAAAQQAAGAYADGTTATPAALLAAVAKWERAVLDGFAVLDSARSSALCIDCGAEVATVKTGLGQRVCSRCLREGATP
jgi:hypothetical protein